MANLTPRITALVESACEQEGIDCNSFKKALVGVGLSTQVELSNSWDSAEEMAAELFPKMDDAAYERACEYLLDQAPEMRPPPDPIVFAKVEASSRSSAAHIACERTLPKAQTLPNDAIGEGGGSICRASATGVQNKSMNALLAEFRLVIPLFQRRYCWGEEQWKSLVLDAMSGGEHMLGRLTAYEVRSAGNHPAIVVCDGQQRSTTTLLLLAAIRDLCEEIGVAAQHLLEKLNKLLCPDRMGLMSLTRPAADAGSDMPSAALSPTYLDRPAFFEAILPAALRAKWASRKAVPGSSDKPLKAKTFFVDFIREEVLHKDMSSLAEPRLDNLVKSVLSFVWLYFPLSLDGPNAEAKAQDDVFRIFQRLAWREGNVNKFVAAQRQGVTMRPADLARSLLLSSFLSEAACIAAYARWLQVEKAGAAVAARCGQPGDVAGHIDLVLNCFLATQSEAAGAWHDPATSGLQSITQGYEMSDDAELLTMDKFDRIMQRHIDAKLEDRFRSWLTKVVTGGSGEDGAIQAALADSESVSRATAAALERLATYAEKCLQDDEEIWKAVSTAAAAKQRDVTLVEALRQKVESDNERKREWWLQELQAVASSPTKSPGE